MARLWLFLAALIGAAAVAAGAMTATGSTKSHDFDDQLVARGLDEATVAHRIEQAETAVKYHLTHALAMLGAGLLAWSSRSVFAHLSAFAFLVGILLFSGSLYALVFFEYEPATRVVPFGGVTLIVAWLLLALGSLFAGHRYIAVDPPRSTMDDRA
jgi:uncharacterized membrane protein YgdD (TMEM256/DUF423 family)